MDFLIILTILGFLISIYSISEDHKKRNFTFKFGWISWIICIVFVVFIIFSILVGGYYSLPGNEIQVSILGLNLTSGFVSLIITFMFSIIFLIFVLIRLHSKNISRKNAFIESLREKLNRKQYGVVAYDFAKYFNSIKDMQKKSLEEKSDTQIVHEVVMSSSKKDSVRKVKIKSLYFRLINLIAKLNPNYKKRLNYSSNLKNFLWDATADEKFLEHLLNTELQTAIQILEFDFNFISEDLWERYVHILMTDQHSQLFKELSDQNSCSPVLTEYLFNNNELMRKINITRPIGQEVLKYLEEENSKLPLGSLDKNNEFSERYQEKKLTSPLHVGIEFIRQMILSATDQNIKDHLWLMFYEDFVKHIEKNYDLDVSKNKEAEFSNMYEFYLYEVFSNYCGWIKKANKYTPKIKKADSEWENHIIKEAIISWNISLRNLLQSDKIRDKFKIYLQNIYLEVYFELALSKDKKLNELSQVFIESLKREIKGYGKLPNQEIKNYLLISLNDKTSRDIWREKLHVEMQPGGTEKIQELIKTLNL